MSDSQTTARVEDRSVPPPLSEPVQQFRAPPTRKAEYLGDAVRQASPEPRVTVQNAPPQASIHFSILEMVRFANDYLRNSPDECLRERTHECQRIEMFLIMSGNFSGYRFLEPRPTDMTRREYTIVPRLLYSASQPTTW